MVSILSLKAPSEGVTTLPARGSSRQKPLGGFWGLTKCELQRNTKIDQAKGFLDVGFHLLLHWAQTLEVISGVCMRRPGESHGSVVRASSAPLRLDKPAARFLDDYTIGDDAPLIWS